MGPGVPYMLQRVVKGIGCIEQHIQKVSQREQAVYKEAVQQLRNDLRAEERLFHILKLVKVVELTLGFRHLQPQS